MKFVILTVLGLSLASCGSSSEETLVQKTAESTIRMVTPDGGPLGSASIIEYHNKKYIITNWHVCRHAVDGYATYSPFKNVVTSGKVLKSSIDVDLCAIEFSFNAQFNKSALILANDYHLYEKVMALGYPLTHELTPSFGYILTRQLIPVAFRPDLIAGCPKGTMNVLNLICVTMYDVIMTNIITYGGNSGSPVVDMNGHVVGIINSGDNETNSGNFIPLDSLVKFLDSLENHG